MTLRSQARIAGWTLAVLCAGVFFWGVRLDDSPFLSRGPEGYYGLLRSGFRAGHLYVDLAPNPNLLALPDPYDPVANGPYRAHDMSLWRGHYYLYYGVTPAVVFFWPFAALTGWYPTEALAVAVFCAGGFLAAAVLLAAIRLRHFPQAPAWTLATGILCLALASPVLTLTAGVRFYEVPISCAFFFGMLMLGAIFRAMQSVRHPAEWLAAASLCFGLAVGARPDYFLAGCFLLIPVAWLARQADRPAAAWIKFGLAAAVPAALCGAGLLLYNWLRFGSLAEFGWHYQLAGQSNLHDHAFDPGFFFSHGAKYLAGEGFWQKYYPFFAPPGGEAYGMARYIPWCWLAVPALLLTPAGSREREGYRPFILLLLLAAVVNLAVLSCFQITTGRYLVDYVPAFLLLGSIGALSLAARPSGRPGPRRLATGAIVAAALFSVFVEVSVFLSVFPHPERLFALARVADWPAHLWERAAGEQLGGLRLELQLPEGRTGVTEPLFETGVAADCRDWLEISYLKDNRARMAFFHAGLGSVVGPTFALPENRRITVEAQCGSLLPPYAHPVFAAWTPQDYAAASRDVRVTVDGAEVLRAALSCYSSPPQDLRIGTKGWGGDGMTDHFSGRVLVWRRLPLPRASAPLPPLSRRAPIDLQVIFPADRSAGSEPLVATGAGPGAELIYCNYVGPGRLRFAIAHADPLAPEGGVVDFDPARPHRLEVWIGSLADRNQPETDPFQVPLDRRVVVRMDGVVALNAAGRFAAADPGSIRIGLNPFPSSPIAARFTGLVLGADQAVDFRGLPALRAASAFGAVDLRVLFPQDALGTAQPLVVTGVTGAGDMLYVRYPDAAHVVFGFDHWNGGGPVSPSYRIDYARPHAIEVTMGSLYRPGAAGTWARRVRVKMDGAVVLDGVSAFHPTRPEDIRIGENPIGGSSCDAAFTGRILSLSRPAQPGE